MAERRQGSHLPGRAESRRVRSDARPGGIGDHFGRRRQRESREGLRRHGPLADSALYSSAARVAISRRRTGSGEKRIVLIHHAGRHIGKALDDRLRTAHTAFDDGGIGTCATIVGRSVDRDGVPVGGAQLEPFVWPMGDYSSRLPGTTAGADGRFRHLAVLPGVDYQVNLRLGFMPTIARQRLSVKPGETIDLGRRERQAVRVTPRAACAAAKTLLIFLQEVRRLSLTLYDVDRRRET